MKNDFQFENTFERNSVILLAERTGLEPATPGVTGRYLALFPDLLKTCETLNAPLDADSIGRRGLAGTLLLLIHQTKLSLTKHDMTTVNIHEAKTHLSRLVDEVAAGAEIIIAKAGKPMARLTPIAAPARKKCLGLLKGKIKVPEDFNAPLDDKTLAAFEGR